MSNAGTRRPSTYIPSLVREITRAEDFGIAVPDPFGVMRIPLVNGVQYKIQTTFAVPKLWFPKSAGPGSLISISGVGPVTMFVDGDDDAQFWGRDIGAIGLTQVSFFDISNFGAGLGSVLFDLVGGTDSFVAIAQSSIGFFKRIGNLVDVVIQAPAQTQDTGNAEGWVLRTSPGFGAGHSFSNRRFIGSPFLPDMKSSAVTILGTPDAVSFSSDNVVMGKPGNAFVHIDSATTPGSYSFNGQNYEGASQGQFFRADIVGLGIVQQDDVSVAVLAFSDSLAAPGVDTTVSFSAPQDLVRGQSILLDGGTYAGAYAIVRVGDDQTSIDIAVIFAGASVGTLALTEHTVASTPFVRDETITISGTTNYNATVSILRKTDTTFVAPQVFAGDDATGLAGSTGRDQTSVGILAIGNGAQENSAIIGDAGWNGNVSSTAISDGAYVPLVLSGVTLEAGAERVSLADAASGTLQYNGEAPARMTLIFSLHAEKAGASAAQYRIAVSVNGAIPVFASASYAPLELRDVNKQVFYSPTIQLEPGDTIQPKVAGSATTVAVTFTDGQVIART